jgi:metal-sulfur cluster biosynthetic enzyme
MSVHEGVVWDALLEVTDPELGVDVVNLGLIYGVTVDGSAVHVDMTLTSIGCPVADRLEHAVRHEIGRLDGVQEVDVDFTFDPPWSPERITEEGRDQLIALGYI